MTAFFGNDRVTAWRDSALSSCSERPRNGGFCFSDTQTSFTGVRFAKCSKGSRQSGKTLRSGHVDRVAERGCCFRQPVPDVRGVTARAVQINRAVIVNQVKQHTDVRYMCLRTPAWRKNARMQVKRTALCKQVTRACAADAHDRTAVTDVGREAAGDRQRGG